MRAIILAMRGNYFFLNLLKKCCPLLVVILESDDFNVKFLDFGLDGIWNNLNTHMALAVA